ncbi:hypothetical protein H2200_004562 [Cladophialophora chaetospira]|uniref:Metallo-beta-lactamase domain-containing protein n=1 Tax=Cladophialophora chaetospira TaxID=386627 RepID=A0AA38XDC1_9EURO|nr:hypothetical protein H2200_004562 [Cladophialophora chaetospira]
MDNSVLGCSRGTPSRGKLPGDSTDISTLGRREKAFDIPDSCPFTIQEIPSNDNTSSNAWLIREHDQYGEFPHIYAKICSSKTREPGTQELRVILLSDTGCGTEVSNTKFSSDTAASCGVEIEDGFIIVRREHEVWNIRTFLEYTINPGGKIPYLVIATHCHYDHILGIRKLLPTAGDAPSPQEAKKTAPTTILASAKGQQFVTPYETLQRHSLCSEIGIQAPRYEVTQWAHDFYPVVYKYPKSSDLGPPYDHILTTPYAIIHTLGHTPDSLSWYDADLRLLCVGDLFYLKQSEHTESAPWGPEAPKPTMFNLDSDFAQWWGALGKVLGFVREKNKDKEFGDEIPKKAGIEGMGNEEFNAPASVKSRVKLTASHTTLGIDAETAVLEMQEFAAAVLRDDVPNVQVADGPRGEQRCLWDFSLGTDDASEEEIVSRLANAEWRFSILAPIKIVEDGRRRINKAEWGAARRQ